MMKVSTILDQIDLGRMALPEFQRGYVWKRRQVRDLMNSLYLRHPVGSLLVWETKTEHADVRGEGKLTAGTVDLLLDGQQRVTSLYGIIRGESPAFFDGDERAFTGLHFHLDEETFEFYSVTKMKDNPLWVDVTELMKNGIDPFVDQVYQNSELRSEAGTYVGRLNAITGIKDVDLHIEQVTGKDKTVDVVVDIFNKVNSGGTKLSKGDLALAKVCARWPDARDELKKRLEKWGSHGFDFKLEWLLRCITTVLTGEAFYSTLEEVDTEAFKRGLEKTEDAIDYLLNLISSRLGLDFNRVLGSRYSFALMAPYVVRRSGRVDAEERDKLLYWYIHTFLWGRYSGSTESKLNQDLTAIEDLDGALDRLIGQLRDVRGDLAIYPSDFDSWSRGSRFYPLMYMLTRAHGAIDWDTGTELSKHLLGKLSRLELHHIFPKSNLYDHEYTRSQVNALANFTFLTQETNLRVSNRDPSEYLEKIARKDPDVLRSHWIPMDRNLWKYENYLDFLDARQQLLAQAANEFLNSMLSGAVADMQARGVSVLEREAPVAPGSVDSDEEERVLRELGTWLQEQGLPEGEYMYELIDPNTNEVLAYIDLAWPEGIQEGLSHPVALLIDEEQETEEIVNRAGYLFFTSVEDLKDYVRTEILAVEPVAA